MADDATRGDGRRLVVIVLLTLWLMAFALSIALFVLTEPSGDGFTRGVNRITVFAGWQGIAGMLALAGFGVSRPLKGAQGVRRSASVPLGITGALWLAIFARIAWAAWE
ncbi:MAG: hypothetical protein AAFN59_10535 [Pseudomonadota bacterium]